MTKLCSSSWWNWLYLSRSRIHYFISSEIIINTYILCACLTVAFQIQLSAYNSCHTMSWSFHFFNGASNDKMFTLTLSSSISASVRKVSWQDLWKKWTKFSSPRINTTFCDQKFSRRCGLIRFNWCVQYVKVVGIWAYVKVQWLNLISKLRSTNH